MKNLMLDDRGPTWKGLPGALCPPLPALQEGVEARVLPVTVIDLRGAYYSINWIHK